MKIAQWLNTARIMGILYALFVLSLGWHVYNQYDSGLRNWQLFLSGALVSLPLLIQYAYIGTLMEVWRQHRINGAISGRFARIIYWFLRIFGSLIYLIIVALILVFFLEGPDFWQNLRDFLDTWWFLLIMGVAMALAWRWEWMGAIVFTLIGSFFLFVIPDDFYSFMMTFLFPSAQFLMFAAGFWLNWRWHKEIRAVLRNEPISLEQPAG